MHLSERARRGAATVLTRFREILFPLLVVSIIASLWAVGRCQEMEDDIRAGVGPSPRWTALVDYSTRTSPD
jgi:hypothetical protein